jgi:hypothetical protein
MRDEACPRRGDCLHNACRASTDSGTEECFAFGHMRTGGEIAMLRRSVSKLPKANQFCLRLTMQLDDGSLSARRSRAEDAIRIAAISVRRHTTLDRSGPARHNRLQGNLACRFAITFGRRSKNDIPGTNCTAVGRWSSSRSSSRNNQSSSRPAHEAVNRCLIGFLCLSC